MNKNRCHVTQFKDVCNTKIQKFSRALPLDRINFLDLIGTLKLEKCSESFENNSYDDLDYIKSMTIVQLNDRLRTVNIHEKIWPQTEVFAAFSILKSEKKHEDHEKEEPI